MNKGKEREKGSEGRGEGRRAWPPEQPARGLAVRSAGRQQRRAAVRRVTSPPTAEEHFLPRRPRPSQHGHDSCHT